MLPIKALAQGIERARADVAINDPETGQTEQQNRRFCCAALPGGERDWSRRQESRELRLWAQNSPFLCAI